MTLSDAVSCCPKGVFAICGGQKLTVAYRFFISLGVFGRTKAGQSWSLVNSRYVSWTSNHVLTGKCHINFTVVKSIRDEIAL